MWHTTVHQIDPIKRTQEEVLEKNISLDGIINISASPYGIGKKEQREQRANEIAQTLQAPFIYVNSLVFMMKFSLMDKVSFTMAKNSTLCPASKKL